MEKVVYCKVVRETLDRQGYTQTGRYFGVGGRLRGIALSGIGIGADDFAPGAEISAGIDAAAHDGTPLTTEWAVFAEATDLRKGGDAETPPARIDVRVLQANAATVRFLAPAQPGAYRLFITARDRGGKVATANLPFRVR